MVGEASAHVSFARDGLKAMHDIPRYGEPGPDVGVGRFDAAIKKGIGAQNIILKESSRGRAISSGCNYKNIRRLDRMHT